MEKIKNKPIFLTFYIFVTLVFVGLFTSSFVVRDRLDHIVYGNRFVQIDGEYVSEILSTNNNLSTITVHLKNPALLNEGDVSFHLLDGDTVIREIVFTGSNIGDPGDVKLKFAPINDSSGRNYSAKIVVSQNEPKISVFVDDEDNLGGWYYFRNPLSLAGVLGSISLFVGNRFSDVLFLVMWGGVLLLVSVLYFRQKQ